MKSILVILRRVYLDITGNHCAAKLIEYFKHWRSWKLKHHRTEWVYMPLKRIYEDLMGEHSLHVIRAARDLLVRLGILQMRRNPGNGQDKTWQYRLNWEVLQQRLTEHCKSQEEHPTRRNEQALTQDPSPNIKFTTSTVVNTEAEEPAKVRDAITQAPFKSSVSPPNEDKEPQPEAEVNSLDKSWVLPCIGQLKQNRVDVGDENLQATARKYTDRLQSAVSAWLEWARKTCVDNPTRSLSRAIEQNWQPQQKSAPAQINSPSPQQIAYIEQLKRDRIIREIWEQPWGDGVALVLYDGKQVIPWWEFGESFHNRNALP
jgi:hypothetical protein